MRNKMFKLHTGKRSKIFFCKLIVASIAITSLILYTIDSSTFQLSNHMARLFSRPIEWNWPATMQQQEAKWDQLYLVHSTGCHMPSFPVTNSKIQAYMSVWSPIKCDTALTVSNDTHIWIPHSPDDLSDEFQINDTDTISCQVYPLIRLTDKTNLINTTDGMSFGYGESVEARHEFVQVKCQYANHSKSSVSFEDYYQFFLPAKDHISSKTKESTNENKTKLNVMIIGLDAVSRLSLHRSMERTSQLLRKLHAIEMFGYNKIGDNTYPNLIPALTGLDSTELDTTCLIGSNVSYDKCNFIWDHYKERGYRTLFAEDVAYIGLFNYFRPGFIQQRTDYRLRPMIVEMESHVASHHKGNTFFCLGAKRTIDIFLDYIARFVRSIGWSPYFSIFWSSSYTHDYIDSPQLFDEQFESLLVNLTQSESFNNTFLVVMSDHGMRFGSFRNTYQGTMEERQPCLFLLPPKWFTHQYPEATLNLISNRRSLTSHFDLYETLRDIIEPDHITSSAINQRSIDLASTEPMPRGISLFLPIPTARTCTMAGISPHWCTCHEKRTIATTNPKVQTVARLVVQRINSMVATFAQCQRLSLNAILDAHVGASNVDVIGSGKENNFSDITVRLQTKPGLAEFEATVRVHEDNSPLEITDTISRTNLYGTQSECVDNFRIKLYCFCDSFL